MKPLRARRAATLALVTLALAAAAALALWSWQTHRYADSNLRSRMAQRASPLKSTRIPCQDLGARSPWVLLVLGQSNAGNHGTQTHPPAGPVDVIADDGTCHRTFDPLPGATGLGGSIWSHLPAALASEGVTRPVVFGILAIDASTSREWTAPGGPLPELLDKLVHTTNALGMPAGLVLWQQGESDGRDGTSSTAYESALVKLSAQLKIAGTGARMVVAKSTICRSEPHEAVRSAVNRLVAHRDFLPGPDTDTLDSSFDRTDGCHLSSRGLQSAATLWAKALRPLAR